MKFNGYLGQATLLKRTLKFLAEAAILNKQKIMLRCPNLDLPSNCDLLGTKIWFSNATENNCLPTWELVEVDGGSLICINPNFVTPLVLEAICNGIISELNSFTVTHSNTIYKQFNSQNIWLEDNDGKKCYLSLEGSIIGDDHSCGYFPDPMNTKTEELNKIIDIHKEGHRAIIFYCVMHTGLSRLKLHNNINPEYRTLLYQAVQQGVELLAYKVAISYQGIEIISPLPISLPEDVISNQI